MKKFTIKTLATSLSAVIATTVAMQAQASDIEIYTVPDQAQKTIVMMLDTSGSMRECDVSVTLPIQVVQNGRFVTRNLTQNIYSLNYWNFEAHYNSYSTDGVTRRYPNHAVINPYSGTEKSTTTPQYDRDFCYGQDARGNRDTTRKYYDRMTRLKDAIFDLMDSQKLDDSMHVAVGQFTDGTKGTIQVASAPLTDAHRAKIKAYVAGIAGSGGTPMASAYATAAAYMMGTNTTATPPSIDYVRQLWVEDPRSAGTFMYCGRKDATNPSTTSDSISTLNVDNTGACTGISHSNARKTEAQALSEGFKIQACRGRDNSGLVFSNRVGDIRPRCLYKDNDIVTIRNIDANVYNSTYSGFEKSVGDSKAGSNYKTPLPTQGRECSGQSIYFLTDGYPNNVDATQHLMRAALSDKAGDFPVANTAFNDATKYLSSNNGEGMAPAGELAKRLRDPERNPQGVVVKTALVGFGADFAEAKNAKKTEDSNGQPLLNEKGKARAYYDCSKITKREIRNACNFGEKSHASLPGVGGYGEGGFYYAEDSQDLIQSFIDVASDIDITFDSITTGSPTIPVNSLNRQTLLSDAYYASFVPKPDQSQQLWTGNMNKYTTKGGTLYGQSDKPLFKNGLVDADVLGMWDRDVEEAGVRKTLKGVHGNLKLRTDVQNNTQRKVYTEGASNTRALTQVTVQALNTGALRSSPAKNHWLNLLGYEVAENEVVDFTKLSDKAELRQLGATMHSSPLALTQSGKIVVNTRNELVESNRDDYVVYGSTQGVLHIVDADTGEEKFAFVPQKMVEKQKQAFLRETATSGGKDNLFYGIDGAWVNHTEYVVRADGALTVGSANSSDANAPKGKQWIYGGLRMGGKNYYSLDLSGIANPAKEGVANATVGQVTGTPVLKFNIDPEEMAVYSAQGKTSYPELAKMGQSWSRPSLGYVRWNGERKLVMFVGGGYDEGYEASDYNQTNGVGAGVYMFDADTGALLWWASNNSVTGGTVEKHNTEGDDSSSLQYSVASRINTIDRDGDGLIDALYFGDLAGQGFRIDLNNAHKVASGSTPATPFSIRVVKIFNEHTDDGLSPRFYEMPSISIHDAEDGSRFAVAAFGSGDRSSPLAGERKDSYGNTITKNANTADDMTLVVYDYDVGNSAWKTLSVDNLKTRYTKGALKTAELNSQYKDTEREVVADGANQGWKYTFPADKKGRYKTFGVPFAITNLLFVNTYDRDGGSLGGECGGGVIGVSRAYQFCLPTGICKENEHGYVRNQETPIASNSTPGLVEMTLGLNDKGVGNLGNISNSQDSTADDNQRIDCTATPEAPECLNVETPSTISQLRWYEARKGS